MSKKIMRMALLIALASFALGTIAIAEDASKVPSKKQQTTVKPPARQCEEGRSWRDKRAECIKTGAPCRYLKNDPAF